MTELQRRSAGARELTEEAKALGDMEESVTTHWRAMKDLLIVVRCPSCQRPGSIDVSRCMALHCARGDGGCGCHFCAWCMGACSDSGAAHDHVSECRLNPNRPAFFASEEDLLKSRKWEQRLRVVAFLRDSIAPRHRKAAWALGFAKLPAICDLGLRWEDVCCGCCGVMSRGKGSKVTVRRVSITGSKANAGSRAGTVGWVRCRTCTLRGASCRASPSLGLGAALRCRGAQLRAPWSTTACAASGVGLQT